LLFRNLRMGKRGDFAINKLPKKETTEQAVGSVGTQRFRDCACVALQGKRVS